MGSSVTPLGEGQRMVDLGEALRARLHPRLAPVLDVLPQFSRYTVVSGLALILDFAVYPAARCRRDTVVLAGAFGYACGLALHYLLSVRYVFDPRATNKAQTRLLAEFALSGLAGMAITALVIALTVDLGRHTSTAGQGAGGRGELPGGVCAAPQRGVCRAGARLGRSCDRHFPARKRHP